MPDTQAGSDQFDATVDLLLDSEDYTKATFQDGEILKLLNRTAWLANRIRKMLKLGSNVVASVTSFLPAVPLFTPADFTVSAGSPVCTSTSSKNLYYEIPADIPDGAAITSVMVYMTGGAGHAGLPATMPGVSITRRNLATGIDATSAVTHDPAANFAALELAHSFNASIGATIDRTTYRHFITVSTEGGAGAVAGDIISGVSATYTPG